MSPGHSRWGRTQSFPARADPSPSTFVCSPQSSLNPDLWVCMETQSKGTIDKIIVPARALPLLEVGEAGLKVPTPS